MKLCPTSTTRPGSATATGVFVAAVILVGAGCSATSPQSSAPPANPETGQTTPVTSLVDEQTSTTTTVVANTVEAGTDEATLVVGPSRDKASARGFAIGVAELPELMFYAQNTELTAVFGTIFHPEHHDALTEQLVGELAPARAALAEAATLERTWFIVRALTSEVTAFDTDAGVATVEVWTMQIFSRHGVAEPYSVFTTNTLNIAWTDEGWRVTAWSDTPGPTPRLSLSEFPSTAAELDRQLDGHRLLHEDGPVS